MKKIIIMITLFASLVFATSPVEKPFSPSVKYIMSYDKNTTCLVRHFKIFKDPKWVAKIEIRTGRLFIFPLRNPCLNFIIDLENGLILV